MMAYSNDPLKACPKRDINMGESVPRKRERATNREKRIESEKFAIGAKNHRRRHTLCAYLINPPFFIRRYERPCNYYYVILLMRYGCDNWLFRAIEFFHRALM